MIRRAVGHDDELRAGGGCLARGPWQPDVLADDDPDAHPGNVDDAGFGARLEIALLVEYRVIGQLLLAIDCRDTSVAHDRLRVMALAGNELGKADEHDGARDLCGEASEFLGAGVEKRRAQQQIFRRVPAQRELRRHDQIGAAAPRLGDRGEDARRISAQIADHAVELGDADAHA